jgi:sarcosine oxidase subunit beta
MRIMNGVRTMRTSMEAATMTGGNGHSDTLVVGGGVFGASAAFHLAEAGVAPVLVERQHLADGPTGRSSANIRLHYTTPELADIAWMGWQLMDRFDERVGGDNGFMRVGILYAIAPKDVGAFETNVRRLAADGRPIETRTVAEMADMVPGFRLDGIALGVWEPRSGYADPVGTTVRFAEAARRLGAAIRVNTSVTRLLVDGGRIKGAELADGTRIAASRVVVAAGPWGRGLLAGVGVDLPTYPERHAISIVAAPEGSRAVVPSVFSDRINRYYVRPEGDALILFGGHTSRTARVDDADGVDARVSLEESSEHIDRAMPRIPALGSMGIRPGYASVYDMSPDGFPIIDAVPGIGGLFVVAGTSGHGFKLAAGVGALVADLVTGKRTPLLRPFRFDRDFGPTGELSA